MRAIILAGGRGTRLYPYTTVLPKPLMPVNEKPVLEIIINRLKKYNFNNITIATGYLAELIESYFGNGEKFGVKINYSRERTPLGTAGPLSLIKNTDNDFLVINGDILTSLNFSRLIDFHLSPPRGIATIAVHRKKLKINLGVLEFDKVNLL
ncbi:MAG: sugar phosphate nucleotidyltransferase, partial [Elusimicrobiota bacterium]